jgi:hypothetical protein
MDSKLLNELMNPLVFKLAATLGDLRDCWQDEKEYEDFAEYDKVLRAKFFGYGLKFIKSTKRPFGCVLAVGGWTVTVFANNRQIGWKAVR